MMRFIVISVFFLLLIDIGKKNHFFSRLKNLAVVFGNSYKKTYNNYCPTLFCIRIAFERSAVSTILMFSALYLLPHIFPEYTPNSVKTIDIDDVFGIFTVPIFTFQLKIDVFMPVLETFLFQIILIGLLRRFGIKTIYTFFVSMLVFAALHFYFNGWISGILAGVIGGCYYAFSFLYWYRSSLWSACWVTMLAHILDNSILLTVAYNFSRL